MDFSPRNWYKYLGQGERKTDQSDASGEKTAGGRFLSMGEEADISDDKELTVCENRVKSC